MFGGFNFMKKGYLAVIETLGNALISKDTEISLLKYDIERLENKIKSIENYCQNLCEKVNK
jgi:chaperonin cofactor prefoldin